MKNTGLVIVAAALFSAMFTVTSRGASISVTNSTQLQAALDTARTNGEDDIIDLEIGTYTTSGNPFSYGTAGNDNHSVTLRGGWNNLTPGFQWDDPGATKLDGGCVNPVLQIDSNAPGVNITFVIENLTIQNGYARSTDYAGAGILAFAGNNGNINLTISNCVLQNNNAANGKSGGAIYSIGTINVYDSKFLTNSASSGGAMLIGYDSDDDPSALSAVENCYFEDNYNYGNQGHDIYYNCALRVSGCTFKGRSDGAGSSGNGSAFYGTGGSYLNIANSSFSGIRIAYWGSAIQTFNGAMDITNCLFYDNHAGVGTANGYGTIAYYDNGNPTGVKTINITNCTFSGNTAAASYTAVTHNRGGIFNLNNCIFWNNDGETGVYNEYGTTTMRYCAYDNGTMGYGVTDGGNNFYQNPMFIDDDVFRLGAASPCIDRGNNDLVPSGITTDVAGKSRFRDDPYTIDTGNGTAPIVDIGAYEFTQTARFGYVNEKKNVKLTLKSIDNNDLTFALSGAPYAYGTTDPCDPTFELIEIYNYNDGAEKAALTITTKAKAGSSVGSILCIGPMKSITAKNIDLTGEITIGSASIGSKAAVTIVFDQGKDLNINSDMPIKSISTFDWWGSLTAPSVGSITAKSNYKLDKWGALSVDADVSGDIGSISIASWLEGTWSCQSVKSIAASYTDDFFLTLSQKPDAKKPALGKLTIKNDFDYSRIISSGNIGTVTVGTFYKSSCFAGVDPTYLIDLNTDEVLDLPPASAAAFSETATIKSFAIKGVKNDDPPYFVNSNIAAANVLSVSLLYPQYDNGGINCGITADYIKSIKVKDQWETVTKTNLDEQADLLGEDPPGNLKIQLF